MKNSRTRDRQSLRHSEISSVKAETGNSAAALLLFTPPQKESEERKKPVCSARTDLQCWLSQKLQEGTPGHFPGSHLSIQHDRNTVWSNTPAILSWGTAGATSCRPPPTLPSCLGLNLAFQVGKMTCPLSLTLGVNMEPSSGQGI